MVLKKSKINQCLWLDFQDNWKTSQRNGANPSPTKHYFRKQGKKSGLMVLKKSKINQCLWLDLKDNWKTSQRNGANQALLNIYFRKKRWADGVEEIKDANPSPTKNIFQKKKKKVKANPSKFLMEKGEKDFLLTKLQTLFWKQVGSYCILFILKIPRNINA